MSQPHRIPAAAHGGLLLTRRVKKETRSDREVCRMWRERGEMKGEKREKEKEKEKRGEGDREGE